MTSALLEASITLMEVKHDNYRDICKTQFLQMDVCDCGIIINTNNVDHFCKVYTGST